MLNNIKELRQALGVLNTQYITIEHVRKVRVQFLTDPLAAVKSIVSGRGIDDSILKFVTIFEISENLELAKDDALTIINNSLIAEIEKLQIAEEDVTDKLNNIISANTDTINLLTNDSRIEVVYSAINKALTALPFAELFEKRLEANMQKIMTTFGVNTVGYIPWLYGMVSELETDNILDMLDQSTLPSKEKYLKDNVPVEPNSHYARTITDLSIEQPELAPEHNGLIHFTKTPDSNISGLSVIRELFQQVLSVRKLLQDNPHAYTFTNINIANKLHSLVTEELKDQTSDLVKMDEPCQQYHNYIQNMAVVVRSVVNDESMLGIELNKYSHLHDVLSDATLN